MWWWTKRPECRRTAAQAAANAALIRAETDKIKTTQEAAKAAEARKAMAEADQQKMCQLTLLGGILDDDEDETPLYSTLTDRKRSKKKPLLQKLGNRPQWQAPTCTVADAVRMFRD